MDWVEEFYAQQHKWSGVYAGGIGDVHRRRVRIMEQWSSPVGCSSSRSEECAPFKGRTGIAPQRVLELGAGGGQFAAAAADVGYDVTAIELIPSLAQHIRTLAEERRKGEVTVIEADFYEVTGIGTFDVVCYWDGFGIGSDDDQRRLLRRVYDWLRPGGIAVINVYTPWYWAQARGREMDVGDVMRRYDFHFQSSRMLDRWWPKQHEEQAVTQSLRCYSPADFSLLLRGTGLTLDALQPGGAMNYDTMRYLEDVSLGEAMSYTVKLVRD